MTERFEYLESTAGCAIWDNNDDSVFEFSIECKENIQAAKGLCSLLNELEHENRMLRLKLATHKHPLWSTREAERVINEVLKQQLNMDKTSITSFALYQVAKRFFWKDEVEILNKSHDGIGVYKIIIKKPKSDALMSIFLDDLKRTFNFQDGTKLIISCEIELFKGLF